ncbi:TPA: helix-turn-helix domain-containing protein [Pseudomonas aeruginosa]|nr:helix-turn-helix domain-containing protein [Pseudomonas aeruginosa]HBO2270913.1 helix-turn-helix domain-containing protein [Pseudomonas aeruginosa]HCE6798080.1 helix-turn-helix domain-containing protein [Pseudomonas aeruginosa]HCK5610968.1 helix-turn-helix domain-containing protein [Pseudomonas aeruginosa]HCL3991287.1 helix-turn-helix domain-containing protein [Pseudomonas aeruginosa]
MLGNKSASAVVDRLLSVYGVRNDNQLSEILQIKRSTLGNWRSRDSVPYTICVSAAEEKGVSLDWLLTGEGPMWRGADSQKVEPTPADPRELALLALWRELDEGEQREIQLAAEEKKRLKILEQRLAELEAVVADAKRLA